MSGAPDNNDLEWLDVIIRRVNNLWSTLKFRQVPVELSAFGFALQLGLWEPAWAQAEGSHWTLTGLSDVSLHRPSGWPQTWAMPSPVLGLQASTSFLVVSANMVRFEQVSHLYDAYLSRSRLWVQSLALCQNFMFLDAWNIHLINGLPCVPNVVVHGLNSITWEAESGWSLIKIQTARITQVKNTVSKKQTKPKSKVGIKSGYLQCLTLGGEIKSLLLSFWS